MEAGRTRSDSSLLTMLLLLFFENIIVICLTGFQIVTGDRLLKGLFYIVVLHITAQVYCQCDLVVY